MRLIDADELKAYFQDGTEGYDFSHWTRFDIIDVIDNVPTVEERPNGKWEYTPNGIIYCNLCNHYLGFRGNYCPNCGARMER